MTNIFNTRLLGVCAVIFLGQINVSASFNFDKQYFGVSFTPYVEHLEGLEKSYYKIGYTFENIKAMLTVVSTKFSRVLVKDCLSIHDEYHPNFTYYSGSRPSVFSGEAAALINRSKGTKVLTVLYLTCGPMYVNNTETEVNLAFEAAEKANKIFAGTVEAIGFWKGEGLSDAKLTLKYLQSFQENASQLGVKLGAEYDCFTRLSNQTDPLASLQRQIVNESQFIICNTFRDHEKIGPVQGFQKTEADLLFFKNYLHQYNPKVEVIGFTVWFNSGLDDGKVVDNLRIYWEIASTWAAKHNYPVYLWEAFDNPWQPHPFFNGHVGWWKLENNSLINSITGYMEKVSVFAVDHFTSATTMNQASVRVMDTNKRLIVITALSGIFLHFR